VKKKITYKKPLPVPIVAVNKPRAMNCEFTSSPTSSLKTWNSSEKKKFTSKVLLPVPAVAVNKPKFMNRELASSPTNWLKTRNSSEKKKFNKPKTTAGTGSGYEQA
jgi:hypothetical protein